VKEIQELSEALLSDLSDYPTLMVRVNDFGTAIQQIEEARYQQWLRSIDRGIAEQGLA